MRSEIESACAKEISNMHPGSRYSDPHSWVAWKKKLLASEISIKKTALQFGPVDCLIGWRLFYLSFAQAGREGENRLHLRMVVNNQVWTTTRRITGHGSCV